MSTHNVSIEVDSDAAEVDVRALATLAAEVMAGEGIDVARALAVLLTTDGELQRLNREYRDVDHPTDVLSFPDEPSNDFVGAAATLGDIAISLETASRQADKGNRPLDAELRHAMVHGLLHLCGHDHELDEEEADRMRRREEDYLGDLSLFHDPEGPD